MSLFLIIFVSSYTLSIIHKWKRHSQRDFSAFLLTFGAFCQQGMQHRIHLYSYHFSSMSFLISGLLVYNFYTSVLVSTIVDIRYDSVIKNKKDLLESNMPIGFHNSEVIQNFVKVNALPRKNFSFNSFRFQSPREDDYVDFTRAKVIKSGQNLQDMFMDPHTGLRKVKEGHFAFYCEESIAQAIIPKMFESHEICDTNEILFKRTAPGGFIIKKYSPLRERLTINWLRICENGIRQKMLQYWNRVKAPCTPTGHFNKTRVEYVAPIILLLVLAYFISILILLCEFIHCRRKN